MEKPQSYQPFPDTRWSAIQSLKSANGDERRIAHDRVLRIYWPPVFAYIRAKWNRSEADASDDVQSFFTHAYENGTLEKFDPAKTRFRSFVRVCLDRFLINQHRNESAEIRGGGATHIPTGTAEHEIEIADEHNLEFEFDREWIRSLFSVTLEDLEKSCSTELQIRQLKMFRRYDIDREPHEKITYESLASEFSVSSADVTNYLFAMRKKFRELLLENLRAVTGSDDEFISEAQRLLGRSFKR